MEAWTPFTSLQIEVSLFRDDTDLGDRKPTSARLVIMQTKESEAGFKMTEIDKLHFFL